MSPISYGDDVPDESELRLCGDVAGKRVVELGLGAGPPNAITFAALGAKTMAVDPSSDRVAASQMKPGVVRSLSPTQSGISPWRSRP